MDIARPLPGGPALAANPVPALDPDAPLRRAAEELEAGFLAEMLKGAGLGATPQGFGGGAGEDQFGSFLRLEQARAMVRAGGIGLSETIFRAMQAQAHG